MTPQRFPTDWSSALVIMPHPDDPEYLAAAVAKWVTEGRTVRYVLATRGEAGIAGMPPEQAGPLREQEQRNATRAVGVTHLEFWDEPDSFIRNTAVLRRRIADTVRELKPDVLITEYGGAEWLPGVPNQRDHIEFAAAVDQAYDELPDPPRWLFTTSLQPTHVEDVDDHIETAVVAMAAHERYFAVLDPQTPVLEQARAEVERSCPVHPDSGGRRMAQFAVIRHPG